jgi:hypothetical protein
MKMPFIEGAPKIKEISCIGRNQDKRECGSATKVMWPQINQK